MLFTRSLLALLILTTQPPLDWVTPVPTPTVERVFDLRNGPYQAGHRGIDLRAAQGSRIVSPTSGEVIFAGTVVDRPVLTLRVAGEVLMSVEPVQSDLAAGDWVRRGETLGIIQGPSHCSFSCLHLGVRKDGSYLNPLPFFRDFRPRLLPLREGTVTPTG